jgi:hypothetical protein
VGKVSTGGVVGVAVGDGLGDGEGEAVGEGVATGGGAGESLPPPHADNNNAAEKTDALKRIQKPITAYPLKLCNR